MCTVHRSKNFLTVIRNVYCAHEQHFLDRKTEMCTVHRNKTLSRRYITNVYCAQNAFQTVYRKCLLRTETTLSRRIIRNAYCTQNTFQTVYQKCVLCTETKLSRRYIRYVYCALQQNTMKTAHQ